jgi:spermidine synthase
MTTPAASRPGAPRALVGGVFLASLAAVFLQVSLMKLVAVRMHPLLMFAMIGVALLGYGAAGSFLAGRSSPAPAVAGTHVARYLLCFSATALPAFLVVNAIDVPSAWLCGTLAGFPVLLAMYVVLAVPFLWAGLAMSLAFGAFTSDVNALYFADLLGAGTGSALAVIAVPWVGGLALLALAGAIGAFGAASAGAAAGRRPTLALGFVVMNVLVAGVLAGWRPIEVGMAPDKHGPILSRVAKPGGLAIDFSQWSYFGRVDVTESFDTLPPQFGGDVSPIFTGLKIAQRMLMLDGQAPAFLYRVDRPLEAMTFLAGTSQSPAYLLRSHPQVLVIGVGGATDVLIALARGAAHVTAVELNAVNVHAVRDVFGDYVGHVLDDPRVSVVVAEGRNFAARDSEHYDVVQLSGVDTGAAQGAWGLGTMPESYVYTTEAFSDLLARLAPGGILSVTRDLKLDWAQRVAAGARDALAAQGLDAATRIAILQGKQYGWATLLVKKEPFTPTEMRVLRDFAARFQFPVAYDPLVPATTLFDRVIRDRVASDDLLDLRPATDDWPFLFLSFQWRRIVTLLRKQERPLENPLVFLLANVVGLAVVALALIGWPLWRLRAAWRTVPRKFVVVGYFAALGAGFMLVEVGLMQRFTVFLGSPALSVAVVLAALLVSAGAGSGFARSALARRRLSIPMAIGWIVVLELLLASPWVPGALHRLLWLPLPARLAVCIVVVMVAGLPMGIPFPAGLTRLTTQGSGLVPWGWGINGMVSVVSSLASYVVGMVLGYTSMFYLAAVLYAGALLLWRRL